MGKATDWQADVIEVLRNVDHLTVFNPRRSDWDSSWEQDKENPHFYAQVNWELERLDDADVIAMYFDPDTQSPVSLLELGIYAESKKLVVCCPNGFWRKGNVDIVCSKYGIPIFTSKGSWLVEIMNRLR